MSSDDFICFYDIQIKEMQRVHFCTSKGGTVPTKLVQDVAHVDLTKLTLI